MAELMLFVKRVEVPDPFFDEKNGNSATGAIGMTKGGV